ARADRGRDRGGGAGDGPENAPSLRGALDPRLVARPQLDLRHLALRVQLLPRLDERARRRLDRARPRRAHAAHRRGRLGRRAQTQTSASWRSLANPETPTPTNR